MSWQYLFYRSEIGVEIILPTHYQSAVSTGLSYKALLSTFSSWTWIWRLAILWRWPRGGPPCTPCHVRSAKGLSTAARSLPWVAHETPGSFWSAECSLHRIITTLTWFLLFLRTVTISVQVVYVFTIIILSEWNWRSSSLGNYNNYSIRVRLAFK